MSDLREQREQAEAGRKAPRPPEKIAERCCYCLQPVFAGEHLVERTFQKQTPVRGYPTIVLPGTYPAHYSCWRMQLGLAPEAPEVVAPEASA